MTNDSASAASFGFSAGVAWMVALGMALDTPVPEPLWVVVFVPLAAFTLLWARGWRA